jgi:ketosteroid isomerase-like protein
MACDEPDPIEMVKRVQQMWNTHDLEGLLACFHPDYESVHPCHPERNFKGLVALRASWGATFAALPDFQARLGRCAAMGHTAWTEWCWQGAHAEGGMYESAGVMIFEMADGLIIRAHIYSDILSRAELDWDSVLTDLLDGHSEELE